MLTVALGLSLLMTGGDLGGPEIRLVVEGNAGFAAGVKSGKSGPVGGSKQGQLTPISRRSCTPCGSRSSGRER